MNDTIRIGVIGVKGRGWRHVEQLSSMPKTKVVALCDVDRHILEQRAGQLEAMTDDDEEVARYVDLRDMLDDKSIDAVTIATPNHWHTLAGIWAMQAGKDVYVEKPLSHNVREGRQLVHAARKYNKMCQHGTQSRAFPLVLEAIDLLRKGVIGDVYMARGLCYKWRPSIGHTPDTKAPDHVNYDLWLGPAPKRPFSQNRFHYNWHWFWDYGNGDIGNQGVHEMDFARWGLGVGLPRQIQSMGGSFLFDDDKEVPNTQTACFFYPDENKMLQFEVHPWIVNHQGGFGQGTKQNTGVIFYGSEGYMTANYAGYKTYLGQEREPGPSAHWDENDDAVKLAGWKMWLNALRTRNIDDLAADVEDGHLSSSLCHLANTSHRLRRSLQFDPKQERIINDDKANKMLTRDYRSPFIVPEDDKL